ncbi:SPOR domain-containing protein [Propionivibrio sp.]|uniref:SPOR domain-containing protein n=1 Tax=Propionivibrio sp. TaxID=2212460 RepID=UPI003BF355CD
MATNETSATEVKSDPSDIKRKLAWRMGFAGLMIVGLLGGLALFDYLGRPSETEPSAPQFTEPVPVVKKIITQAVTPTEPTPEMPKEETKAAEPEASAAPVDKAAPAVEPPPRPQVSAQPVLPRASSPAGRSAASAIQPAPAKPVEPRVAPVTAAPARVEPPVAAAQQQPLLQRLFSGYVLQAGVFADPRRAEELHARLTLEGIPSAIEARVQVGPFKNREEAEAARAKMKAMGIESVLLAPKGAKR